MSAVSPNPVLSFVSIAFWKFFNADWKSLREYWTYPMLLSIKASPVLSLVSIFLDKASL
jgi:hypothetical protein